MAGQCHFKVTTPGALPIILYGEAPPERGTFFRLEVYKREEISRAGVLGIKRDFQNISNRCT